MVHRFSRLAVAGLIVAAAALYADDPKCKVAARECDQQIRSILGGRRYLGAIVEERKNGLYVKSVAETSPASRAGLVAGDRLIAVNGKSVTRATHREFKQLVADARRTGILKVFVMRTGKYFKLDVRLEPYTKEQMDKIIASHLETSHKASAAGAN